MAKRTVVLSLVGVKLDFVGKRNDRWARWRPNIGLCSQQDWVVDEIHLLHDSRSSRLSNTLANDIQLVSPETEPVLHEISFTNPWDFEEVYAKLFDWCRGFEFDVDKNDYLFHITTGTHVVQICGYLLTESRHFPGRLVQSSPVSGGGDPSVGTIQIIDLDLSKYDQLANRFAVERYEGEALLKGGIQTNNAQFNRMISQVEKVAIRSKAPILLTGPTGAGKSELAKRIFQLKQQRGTLDGPLVSVNCATLKGENAMAALYGHTRGAFTGALKARDGFLLSANKGVLFLDEIGELGLEEQAMLLHAIENKSFYPVGSDRAVSSDFQLIAGTNRDLLRSIENGEFREDLLARINLWSYQLPALKDRKEDIAANVDYELERFSRDSGHRLSFNAQARDKFMGFALSERAIWRGNFRDLGSAVTRMCTLADVSRISVDDVNDEIERLQASWRSVEAPSNQQSVLNSYLSREQLAELDNFDAVQLAHVISVCLNHPTMASAGRELFQASRLTKASSNDSARLQKYLAKFGLSWSGLKG